MSSRDPGISIRIDNIPARAPRTKWLVKKEIARVLHNRLGFSVNGRPGNFGLDPVSDDNPNPSFLAAILTIPLREIGQEFLSETLKTPVQLYKQPLRFSICDEPPRQKDVDKIYKTFYVDPKMEERHATILDKLQAIGEPKQRSFSVEWKRKYEGKQASLFIDYDRRRFVVQARKKGSSCFYITVPFSTLLEIDIGHASFSNIPYICFDTMTPPSFAQNLSTSEKRGVVPRGGKTNKADAKLKHRVGYLDEAHALVAPYAPYLRVQLHQPETALQTFKQMCAEAEVDESLIKHHFHTLVIPSYYDRMFFSKTRLEKLTRTLESFEWPIAFQLELLVRSSLLHTVDLDLISPALQDLATASTLPYAGDLLRAYGEALRYNKRQRRHSRLAYDEFIENPMDCFQRVRRTFVHSDLKSAFRCCHVTVTPTRMLLEGPYVTQKNRVIRKYSDYQDHFIRVDFRDEDKGRYRSDRDADGTPLLQSRVGGILSKGFILAGRKFEFLAYSNSSLKEHTVWFVHPFQTQNEDRTINASFIRSSLGRFEVHQLMKTPSKYAARIGQAFTSTLDSLNISENKWEELPEDLECGNYCFTDGVGTISKAFAEEIWAKLCEGKRDPPPTPSAAS
ncbi:RNA dependent RNA polymerase-domain-containing protein [Crepidotus variabilis]|uniref:RNA-dependent RNA polymerase n=1 Tax=Crepidotus variabilis TaxID=179855 RepID=A0A9P6EDK5_9AGAR|nr:RNA dependent RNA polymerase-domain-containing protein [Crepidotus variabilis]